MPSSANRPNEITKPLDSYALSSIQALSLLAKLHGIHLDKERLTLAWLDASAARPVEPSTTINIASVTTSLTTTELTMAARSTAVSTSAAKISAVSTTTETALDFKNLNPAQFTDSTSASSVFEAPKEVARRLQYALKKLGFDARIEQGTAQKLIRASPPLIVIGQDGEPIVLEQIKHGHLLLIGSRKRSPVPIANFSSGFANVWVCAQLHTSASTSG